MNSAPVRWFKGFLVVFSLFTTTLFFGALILSLVPIKFILKKTVWDKNIKEALYWLARSWIYSNNGVYSILHKVEWRIIGHTDLNPNGKYLLISNHVSSADILAVFVLAKNRMPFPQFFFEAATALCAGFRSGPVELRDAGDEALQSRIPEPQS